MPSKAIEKKRAKSAPKKAGGPKAPGAPGKGKQDMRRCYEHFGRVTTILPLLREQSEPAVRMVSLAKVLLRQNNAKDAADMLRAAEHFVFGSLAAPAPEDITLSPALLAMLHEEYQRLLERADAHASDGELSKAVLPMLKAMRKQAAAAYKAGKFRAAMEFARGAEALSHGKADLALRLPAGAAHPLELA